MTTDDTPEIPGPATPTADAAATAAERARLEQELQAAAQERARLQDQLQRTLADMQNLRRHTQRQLDESRQSVLTLLMAEFLPVLDNLERAARLSKSPEEIQAGLKQVLALFGGILERRGITRIPTVGGPFDPQVHEAVATEVRSDVAPDTVLEEVEPGYRLDRKVIRIARVKVSRTEARSTTQAGGA